MSTSNSGRRALHPELVLHCLQDVHHQIAGVSCGPIDLRPQVQRGGSVLAVNSRISGQPSHCTAVTHISTPFFLRGLSDNLCNMEAHNRRRDDEEVAAAHLTYEMPKVTGCRAFPASAGIHRIVRGRTDSAEDLPVSHANMVLCVRPTDKNIATIKATDQVATFR